MNRRNISILCAIASVTIMGSVIAKRGKVTIPENLSDVEIKQEYGGEVGNISNVAEDYLQSSTYVADKENNSDESVVTNLSTSKEDNAQTSTIENGLENNKPNQVPGVENKPENDKLNQVPGVESKPENDKPNQVPGVESKPENDKPNQVPGVESKPENDKPNQVPDVENKPENTEPNQDKANEVIKLIDSLNSSISLSDTEAVKKAREAYNNLNEKDQALVTNIYKLINAEKEISRLEEKLEIDQATSKNVIDKISTLDKVITFDDAAKIANIRNEYDKLNTEAKALVTNFDILVKAENDLQNIINKIENANKLINELPKNIALNDKDKVEEARRAYDDLSDINKKGVDSNIVSILEAAELEIAKLEEKLEIDQATSKNVIDKIATLDKAITFDDADKITNIRNEYDKLNPEAKALVTNFDILVKAENELQNILNEIDNVTKLINELPKNITLNDKDKVEEARKAYDDLSDVNKKGVDSNIVSILEAAELEIAKLEEKLEIDQATSKNVIDKIATLDKVITFDDADKITNIRNEYDNLNAEAKALVTNFDILVKAENELQNILNEIDNVTKLINELPKNITLNDKDKVEEARKAYDDLSDVNKKGVDSNIVSILEAAELEIAKLEEKLEIDQATSKNVIDKIATLDKVITFDDADKITNIRNEYDNLNAEAKALVTNFDILVKAENDLQNILNKIDNVTRLINELPENITLNDKDKVEEARRAYDDLSDVNKKGVDSNIVSILEAAELEIAKLETIRDNANVQQIITDINDLPELSTITIADKDQVFDVMKRFRALPEDVQFAVDTTDLVKAFDKVEGLLAVEIVNEINLLPEVDKIKLSDKAKVENLRDRYNELSEKNNGQVINLSKLIEAEAKISELEASIDTQSPVGIIINKINLLEDIITRENVSEQKNKVEEITKLIYLVSSVDKQQIINIEKLKLTRKKVQEMERDIRQAEKVEEWIDELVSVEDLILPLKATVDNAREEYDALSDNAKTLVDPEKLKKLQALEIRITELIGDMHFTHDVEHLMGLIEALPSDVNEINYGHEETIRYARYLFNGFTDEEKAAVINISKLDNAEAEWNKIKAEKNKIADAINKIPSFEKLTLADKQLVEEARKLYDAADTRVHDYIFALEFGTLVRAESKIQTLEKLQDESESATRALIKKIEELTNTELTLEDKDTVLGLRDEFYKLPVDSRELIDFGYIQKLEIRISKLESASK